MDVSLPNHTGEHVKHTIQTSSLRNAAKIEQNLHFTKWNIKNIHIEIF